MKTKKIFSIVMVVVLLSTLFLSISVSQAAIIGIEMSFTQKIEGKENSGYTDDDGNAVYTTVIDNEDIITYEIKVTKPESFNTWNNVVVSAALPNYTEFVAGYTPTSTLTVKGSEPVASVNGVISNNTVRFKLPEMQDNNELTCVFKVKVTQTADTTLKTFNCVAKISSSAFPEIETNKIINSIYPTTAGIKIIAQETGTKPEVFLKDINYELYKQTGAIPNSVSDTKITDLVTDVNGIVVKSDLELGKYYLVNKNVPSGYVITTSPIVFELKEPHRAVPLEIIHEIDKAQPDLNLNVVSERTTVENNIKTPGVYSQKETVNYGVVIANTGNVVVNDIDVDITPPTALTNPKFSIANGNTTVNFPTGEISEVSFDSSVPNKLKIDSLAANKKITVTYSGTISALTEKGNYDLVAVIQGKDVKSKSVTETITVNTEKTTKTNVDFKVVDTNDKPIKNAVFSLEIKQTQTELKRATSNEGNVSFNEIPAGEYLLKQISSDVGKIKTDEVIPVNVSSELDVTFDGSNSLTVRNGIMKYKATIFNDTPNKLGGVVKAGNSKADVYKSFTDNLYTYDETVVMQYTPNTGYVLDRVMVSGVEYYIVGTKLNTSKDGKGTEYPNAIVGTNSISFGNITENINMNVTFKQGIINAPESLKVEMKADKTIVNPDGSKTAGVYKRGDIVKYNINVTNTGSVALKNVNVSCNPSAAIVEGTLNETVIAELASGETKTLVYSAKTASNVAAGLIRNEVKVDCINVQKDENDTDIDYIKIEGDMPVPDVSADVTFTVADTNKTTVVGATYEIVEANNPTEILYTKTSNAIGKINFAGMVQGEYIIRNTNVPKGYEKNTQEIRVVINPDKTVSFNGKTTPYVSVLEITPVKPVEKTTVEMYVSDGENFIADAEFEMKSADTQQQSFYQKGISSDEGKIVFKDVSAGSYFIKQLKTAEGYNISGDKYIVNVDKNSKIEFVLPDKTVVAQLVVLNYKIETDSHTIQGIIDNGGTIDYEKPTLLKDVSHKKITWIPKENYETSEIEVTIGENVDKARFENGGAILKLNGVEYEVKLTKDNVHYIDFGPIADNIIVKVKTIQINPANLKYTVTLRAGSGGTIDGKMSGEVTYKGTENIHTSTIKPNANYTVEKVELFKVEKDGSTKLVSSLTLENNNVSFKVDNDYLVKASFVKDPNATNSKQTNSANTSSKTSGKSGTGSQTGQDGLPFTILLIGIGAAIAVLGVIAYKKDKERKEKQD